MKRRIIGLSGNTTRPSRTRALVETIVARAESRFDLQGTVFDLVDIGPTLGVSAQLNDLTPSAHRIVGALLTADAIVVASPVYKGSYTGLFKHLFDLIDPAALIGKPVLLAASGGGDRHALIIEHQLRPLFGFFEAQSLATGVYASDADFTLGQPTSPPILARVDRAVEQFGPYFTRRPSVVHPSEHAVAI